MKFESMGFFLCDKFQSAVVIGQVYKKRVEVSLANVAALDTDDLR